MEREIEITITSLVDEGNGTHILLGARAKKGVQTKRKIPESRLPSIIKRHGKDITILSAADAKTKEVIVLFPDEVTPVAPAPKKRGPKTGTKHPSKTAVTEVTTDGPGAESGSGIPG